MAKIEAGLHRLHYGGQQSAHERMNVENDSWLTALEPFARITVVSPGSPAQICVSLIN